MDLFKSCKIKSEIVLNRCLNVLYNLANDTKISPVNRVEAIHCIMGHYPQEIERCFYKLFDFREGPDIEAMLKTWNIVFKISDGDLPGFEQIGYEFIQRVLNIMADKNLKLGLRLKAIEFMMMKFKKNAYGFSTGEIHTKAYLHLFELVKTEQFLLNDYLESLRLYFKIMNPGVKKVRFVQQIFASASNE